MAKAKEMQRQSMESRTKKKKKGLLPVPLADPEGVGFAVSAGSQIVDPPLCEARGGLDSISIAHPISRESQGHRNFMDAIEDTFQQELSRLSQVGSSHSPHSS